MKFFSVFFVLILSASAELTLPEILTFQNGKKVSSAEDWPARRSEILNIFRENVYGVNPVERPADLTFELIKSDAKALDGAATLKVVKISFSGLGGKASFKANFFIPNAVKSAPVFLLACHRTESENLDVTRKVKSDFWPVEAIVKRGYCAASFYTGEVDPDKFDNFQNGVHKIFDKKRTKNSWGTIAAWAWGASRVLDYIETDLAMDAQKVAIVGHSRGGKTSLWAGASDDRFAMVVPNNSGCSGAAISKRKEGETIAKIIRFKHWFCKNYNAFANNEDNMPFDQHMLCAAVAPRLLYISSATQDKWADPEGEYLSGVYASQAYELLGKKGLVSESFPKPGGFRHEGNVGYHLRNGKHNLTSFDWHKFMDFADAKMK
ncbi:MAG: hypothetical protein NE334_17560 [Lentisphaeraceae bacterium]|nr:hypothetical protein [Lentisphaeraceae bacterium]